MIINQIAKGDGGGSVAEENDVVFYDFDGSVITSYSATQFANLASLPANPVHTGLTAQGWNWTLSDAKTYVASCSKLNIGQMYTTSDGKTRIYIHLEDGRLAPYLGIAVNGTAAVDWGDGQTDTVTGSSTSTVIKTQHTYSAEGDYVIAIAVTGDMALVGDSTNTNWGSLVLGKNSESYEDRVYQNAIQKVEIGSNTSIGAYAFCHCESLASVIIPSSVTSISTYAFYSCNSLTSIIIPNGVTSIDRDAFENCYSLASVTLPNSVTTIDHYAFQYCCSLASVTLPNSVTSIGNYAFQYCYSLASATISSNMTDWGTYAFSNCYSLTSVTIPSGVTSIGNYAFYYCYSLASVTIPSSVTSIGIQAFYYCYGLGSVTISNGVTSIGGYAFDGCYSLTSVIIPSSVTSINKHMFSGCRSLASITIPSSVTSIGEYAFSSCDGLGFVKFLGSTPPTASGSHSLSSLPTDCIIYVPSASLNTYKRATNYPSSNTYTYVGY